MSKLKREVIDGNAAYAASFGDKANLPTRPARHFLILTCMDARLDPAKFAGLVEGDAHVFRNAGGRATDDAIRSLVISHKMLGTREWFVIHHTGCGMATFDDAAIARLLDTSLSTAQYDGETWSNLKSEGGSPEGHYIQWFSISDAEAAVVEDVRRIRNHPLVSCEIVINGFLYDTKTGRLIEIEKASAIGSTAAS